MRLVMEYDGCVEGEASWTNTCAIEYDSKEKAEYDLLVAWEIIAKGWEEIDEKRRNGIHAQYPSSLIQLFGRCFDFQEFSYRKEKGFKYDAPRFYTLEEWWEKNVKK